MERVKKGEKYWSVVYTSRGGFISLDYTDTDDESDILDYERGNYFATFEEAEAVAKKLRAVLKGADVIEMPSEEELDKKLDECGTVIGKRDWDTQRAFLFAVEWLKSKIVK